MKGFAIQYSAKELAWLEANRLLPISLYHKQFADEFARHDVTAAHLHALRKRRGWKVGRDSWRYQGTLNGNYRGPGHERVDRVTGYVRVVVERVNAKNGKTTYGAQKHILLWEKQNGPVPSGHVLKCLDGDKLNTDPSNWRPMPKGAVARMVLRPGNRPARGYDRAPEELKPSIMAIAMVEHAISTRRRA